MKLASVALLLPLMSQAANYSVKTALVDGVEVVELVQGLGRRVFDVGLELLPLGFPLVAVEARFAHTRSIPLKGPPSNHPKPALDSRG